MLATLLAIVLLQGGIQSIEVDPGIRQVVEAFFAAQEAEDAEAYLALWSSTGARPQAQQLQFIFESGDDRFSELVITHAIVSGTTARVRVSVQRLRTDAKMKRPDGTARSFNTPLQLALALVREGESWKIVREGSPVDELAAALVDEKDPAARSALLKGEPDLVTGRLVDSLARRADGFAQRGELASARNLYERGLEVARLVGDRTLEARALGNLANTHYYMRDFERARALHEERLAIDRAIGNDEGASSALVGIATVLYSTADYTAAMTLYREALEIQERIDAPALVANTLISTGNILYLQGDFAAAIADYRRAVTIKRRFDDLAGAWMALEGLGRTHAAQGDLAAALASFSEVLDERRSHKVGGAPMAVTLHYIGDIHFRLGNTDAARLALDEGRALFEAAGDRSSAGRILQLSALNELVSARPAAAEKAYAGSITACTGAQDAECIAGAQVGLAFALAAQSKYVPAIEWYRKSIASFKALKLIEPAARAHVGLAEALIGKGDYADAHTEAVEARHMAIAIDVDDVLWRALVSAARAERKLGRGDVALGTAKASLATLRSMAEAALKRPGRSLPRDADTAYATAAILHAEAGDPAGAFAVAEEMRARTLRTWLAVNERDISRGMTDAERESERVLAVELTSLLARRQREKELAKPDAGRLTRLDAAILEGEQKRAALLEGIFTRLPDLRTWRGLSPSVGADALDSVITDATSAWLAFVVDERDVLVLLASRPAADGPVVLETQVVAIEKSDLAERIAAALAPAPLMDLAEWRKLTPKLFAIVPAPLASKLVKFSNLYVSPDGVLWRVPFEAMPVGPEYLGEKVTIAYVPSLTALSAPAAAAEGEVGPPLVVSRPALSAETTGRLAITAPNWVLSRQEIEGAKPAVGGDWGGKTPVVLEGEQATAPAVREGMASAAVIYIDAPFRVNAASPLFSPVLLAPVSPDLKVGPTPDGGAGAPSVGPTFRSGASGVGPTFRSGAPGETVGSATEHLETRELFNLSARASLVTFTDPATLSMRDAAAALTSIYWAWRAAGVRTIAVRRWGGVETSGLDAIRALHDGLRAGATPREAWFAARKAVAAAGPRPAPGPWAAWLLIGGH